MYQPCTEGQAAPRTWVPTALSNRVLESPTCSTEVPTACATINDVSTPAPSRPAPPEKAPARCTGAKDSGLAVSTDACRRTSERERSTVGALAGSGCGPDAPAALPASARRAASACACNVSGCAASGAGLAAAKGGQACLGILRKHARLCAVL